MASTPLRNGRLCAWRGLAAAALVAAVALSTSAQAQDKDGVRKDGLYIHVKSPITDAVFGKIKEKITGVLEGKKDQRKIHTIIFDFNPQNQPAATGKDHFGSCSTLAKYIRSLTAEHGIKTVAFVHNELSKHSVLPAIACKELIMSEAGKIGDVTKDQTIDNIERATYRDLTSLPRALVFKMIVGSHEIVRAKFANGSIQYLDREDIDKLEKKSFEPLELPDALKNERTHYTAKEAEALGLCAIYPTPADVIRRYQLPRRVLTEVWLGDETPVVGVIEVRGTLDKGKVQSVERRVDRARGRNVNFLILVLDCEGGDATDAAYQLGKKLADLRDDLGEKPVRTLAYVPSKRSIGAATYLALGCNEIVMANDAVLGDFNYLKTDKDSDHGGRRDQLADLAQRQGYPPALFEAMLDRDLVLYHAQLKGSAAFEVVSEKVYQDDKKAGHAKYSPGAARLAKKDGEYMKLDAAQAKELGIVEHNDVNDLDALYGRVDVSSAGVKFFRDDWLDEIAEFFRGPLVKMVLVMLGIIGLIIELKMPGTAIGGIVAGICFVLFFWAHSFIGEYTMLAVLLFVLGLILIALEIFVFPGFGLPGISGILLIVLSLAIVTLEKMPSTTSDWLQLAGTLGTFAVSLVVAIAAAFMLAWYLPHIPYANRLVLVPPIEPTFGEGRSENPLAALLGAIGVAETPLRPSGKVRFGEDYHDVVAEGDFVNPGSRVQVIEIEGQRIVVKQV